MSQNNDSSKETQARAEDKGKRKFSLPLKISIIIVVLIIAGAICLTLQKGKDGSSEPEVADSYLQKGSEPASQEDRRPSGSLGSAIPEGSLPPSSGEDDDADSYPFYIGLVTGSGDQGEDYYAGIQTVMARYGDAEEGGLIKHRVYPDDFVSRIEEVKATIESLAEDPMVKAIIVFEAVPGTAESFQHIKAKRSDIFLLSAESHEDMQKTSAVTDMYVGTDFISRGYLIPRTAKELGANTLVHVSIPRHMLDEAILRRRSIMEEACKDLGMKFVYENAPDPTADTGVDFAQNFIKEHMPIWLNEYGPDTAFFATNNAHTEPMIAGVIEHGGYFVEADVPSPVMGYPEALGLDIKDIWDDDPQILNRIEEALDEKGASGRLGTWTASMNSANIVALVEFGKLLVLGKADINDYDALLECYENAAQGGKWNGQIYVDAKGATYPDIFLIYEDTYVFGKGFMGNTEVEVPEKYQTLVTFN
jgi:hypothetical protein